MADDQKDLKWLKIAIGAPTFGPPRPSPLVTSTLEQEAVQLASQIRAKEGRSRGRGRSFVAEAAMVDGHTKESCPHPGVADDWGDRPRGSSHQMATKVTVDDANMLRGIAIYLRAVTSQKTDLPEALEELAQRIDTLAAVEGAP